MHKAYFELFAVRLGHVFRDKTDKRLNIGTNAINRNCFEHRNEQLSQFIIKGLTPVVGRCCLQVKHFDNGLDELLVLCGRQFHSVEEEVECADRSLQYNVVSQHV